MSNSKKVQQTVGQFIKKLLEERDALKVQVALKEQAREACAKALLEAGELHLADESTIFQLEHKVADMQEALNLRDAHITALEEQVIALRDNVYALNQVKQLLEENHYTALGTPYEWIDDWGVKHSVEYEGEDPTLAVCRLEPLSSKE